MKVRILFTAVIWFYVLPGFCQGKFQLLDSVLTVLGNEEIFHGQVLIVEQNEVRFAKAYGLKTDGKPYTLHLPLDIESVAKLFTALAVIILVEDGKLKLDDPLTKFFPSLPYNGVNLRHLLNHTSGLPLFFQTVFDHWPHDKLLTNDDLIGLIGKYHPKPISNPGEREQYNQTAYLLLGSVIEKVSSQKYEQFLKERIFVPAGMHSTYHRMENDTAIKTIGAVNIDNLFSAVRGDGNMFSTVTDLSKLDRALSTGVIISKPVLEGAYVTPTLADGTRGRYGYGCSLLSVEKNNRIVQHVGQGTTANTVFTRFIDSQNAVIVLHAESVQYAYPVYQTIENIRNGRQFEMPKRRVVYKIDQKLLEKYAGNYGDNGYMHLTLENGKLFIQPDGNPGKTEIVPSSDTTFYFTDQAVDWQIYLDKDGKVIGFGPLGQKGDMMIRQK